MQKIEKIEPNLCHTDDGLDTITGKWKLPILFISKVNLFLIIKKMYL